MCALPGETHASSSRVPKQRRGVLRRVPALTLVLPNTAAKHRHKRHRTTWKYQIAYIQNRWYAQYRPRYRKLLQRMNLRK